MEKEKSIVIGIAGNPNSGKTSLFNSLTGSRQHVGNWPGVTVERKEGIVKHKGYNIKFVDLPGTYSLSVYSQEEVVTRNYILNEKPDIIVDVVDSSNVERNLYFTVQLMEIGCPIIVALNMFDELKKNKINIDIEKLSELLGLPLVPTCAVKKQGLEELLDAVIVVKSRLDLQSINKLFYTVELQNEIDLITDILSKDEELSSKYPLNWLAIKLLERDQLVYKMLHDRVIWINLDHTIDKSISRLKSHFEMEPEVVISEARYGFLHGAIKETVTFGEIHEASTTEKIDSVLLHKFFGFPIFLIFIWLVFQITFKVGSIPMGWLEIAFGALADFFINILPNGLIRSLIVDGIIAGVGGVLVFLPTILILFMAISFMENSGYMARVAFLMDKLMHRIGLHGRSFIPMIMGFGCSVPALMACRSLKNKNDRLTTMLVIPFMSCGAKLPVYLLLIGTFFGMQKAANILFIIYIAGVLFAIAFSKFFKSTILSGSKEPFVMELPPYRMPTFTNIFLHMWEKAYLYLKKAGTVILFASVIIWFLSSFPVNKKPEADLITNQPAILNSYVGRIGKFIEPAIKPLGFDWRTGIALIAGLSAKELVVSTLGTIYSIGEESQDLRDILRKDPHFTRNVAISLIIFVLLYLPCLSSLIIFYKETLSIKWTFFMISYTIGIAYVTSLIVYQTLEHI